MPTQSQLLSMIHQEDLRAHEVEQQHDYLKLMAIRDGVVDVGVFGESDHYALADIISDNQDKYLFKCLASLLQAKDSDLNRLQAVQKLLGYLDSLVDDACEVLAVDLCKAAQTRRRGSRYEEV